jgi:hypothetical protein
MNKLAVMEALQNTKPGMWCCVVALQPSKHPHSVTSQMTYVNNDMVTRWKMMITGSKMAKGSGKSEAEEVN